jgi:hypothetical protein
MIDTGIWREVPGEKGLYVSTLGNVGRLQKDGKFRVLKGCANSRGYIWVRLGRKRQVTLHHLVCLAFHGPRPSSKHECRHLNGLKTDNRAENVCWGTRAENIADGMRLGSIPKGERHHSARLTTDLVHEIHASTEAARGLAKRLGVGRSTVRDIRRGITWKHVND